LHMGLYPVLARMVYRDDITESPVIATRNVHIPSLADGKLGFEELVKQGYDDKDFSGLFSSEMLAVGRFPAQFTDEFLESRVPDLNKYWDKQSKSITSVTNELTWTYGDKKYATINSRGTKGVIGFAQDEAVKLDDWEITCRTPFAVVLVTDLSKQGDLKTTHHILITAVARAQNTGMEYEYKDDKTILIHQGSMPLLLEPVKATISVKGKEDFKVIVLDHDGVKTDQTVPANKNTFTIDGGKYKTIYYLIEAD